MGVLLSPCIRVCAVHPALRLCVGCGRSLDEIARWTAFTHEERTAIMAALPPRLALMGASPRAPEGR